MNLQSIFDDITQVFDGQNVNGGSVDVNYIKKYPHSGPVNQHPNRLISEVYRIEADTSNFIVVDYECRDGLRTFQINPDKNTVDVALTVNGQVVANKYYYWED